MPPLTNNHAAFFSFEKMLVKTFTKVNSALSTFFLGSKSTQAHLEALVVDTKPEEVPKVVDTSAIRADLELVEGKPVALNATEQLPFLLIERKLERIEGTVGARTILAARKGFKKHSSSFTSVPEIEEVDVSVEKIAEASSFAVVEDEDEEIFEAFSEEEEKLILSTIIETPSRPVSHLMHPSRKNFSSLLYTLVEGNEEEDAKVQLERIIKVLTDAVIVDDLPIYKRSASPKVEESPVYMTRSLAVCV